MTDPDELTCQEFVELVTDYLEGTLPPAERARFEAHISDCDYCLDYLAQMRRTIRSLGRLSEADISPTDRQRLLDTFRDWKHQSGAAPAV